MLIKSLPACERPRERLIADGVEALTERELIALVLRNGTAGKSALDLATELLAEYGSTQMLAAARPEELATRAGIGPAKAAALVAAFQLGRRGTRQDPVQLRSAADLAAVARAEIGDARRERVLVVICDAGNRVRRIVTVSEGTIDRSAVPVREILNAVLRHDGRAFGIAHNHPSGNAEPGITDQNATEAVKKAATTVGLRFLGHVVVAQDDWRAVG